MGGRLRGSFRRRRLQLCSATPHVMSHLINRRPSLCCDLSSLLWLGIRGMAMLMVSVAAAV